jgi:type I restriction enzyme, S subunit
VSNVLPQGWEEKTLKNSTSILGDGLHGTPKYSENGDYFFINGNNLVEGKIVINEKTKKCSIEEYNKYKKNLNNRTLFVSINGTLGNIAEYKNEKIFLGKSACYFNILEDINKDFIKYVLQTSYFKYYIDTYSTGTTIKNMPLKAMREFTFTIPSDINEQKRIADILSAFDDKIELNNQMNQTLEDMATTLFKEWFENFNFLNEQGKPYKDNDGKMKSSELGEIPIDWEVKSLDQIADFLNGLAMQKYRPKDENNYYPVLKIKELNNGISENSDKCCISIPEKYIIKNGDLIFSWSGTLEVKFWTEGKVGLNQHLFKVTSNTYPKWFYYLWNKKYLSIFKHIAKTKATTMGHIKRKNLSESKVLIPNKNVLNHMHLILEPIIDNIINNSISSQTLKQQRDTLLPKLMSGEIRV